VEILNIFPFPAYWFALVVENDLMKYHEIMKDNGFSRLLRFTELISLGIPPVTDHPILLTHTPFLIVHFNIISISLLFYFALNFPTDLF
jgi:hypothetical protein